jgi:hypothetical protein
MGASNPPTLEAQFMLPSPKIEACFVMLCHASHGTSKIDGKLNNHCQTCIWDKKK